MLICGLLIQGCAELPGVDPHEALRAESLLDQGILKLRQGQLDDAAAAFQVAYEIAPSAGALDGLGCVALLSRNFAQAERLFLRALETEPEYRNALGNLGLLYELTGRRREALQLYQAAIRSNPRNFRFRNNLAALLAEGASSERERAEALNQLREAAALASHPLIMSNLAMLRNK